MGHQYGFWSHRNLPGAWISETKGEILCKNCLCSLDNMNGANSHFTPMHQLCDLYENDSIFDKFECCFSGDGLRVATGSYRSASFVVMNSWYFHIYYTLMFCQAAAHIFSTISAIYFVYLVAPKAVQKLQHLKLLKTQWGKLWLPVEGIGPKEKTREGCLQIKPCISFLFLSCTNLSCWFLFQLRLLYFLQQ